MPAARHRCLGESEAFLLGILVRKPEHELGTELLARMHGNSKNLAALGGLHAVSAARQRSPGGPISTDYTPQGPYSG